MHGDADEQLWGRWRAHHESLGLNPGGITRDGIVDPERFRTSRTRILFVAKESNNYPQGDMRELLRSPSGKFHRYGWGIGRWAHGILNGFPPLDEKSERAYVAEALLQIASINLKKQTGGSTSEFSEILAHAKQDRSLLIEQIALINPSLIIACGTVEFMKKQKGVESLVGLEPTAHEHFYVAAMVDCPVIAFDHPSRKDRLNSYSDLKRRFEEIRIAVHDCGI